MICAKMVSGPVAGATLVVGAILVYCVYDLGSDGQLARMASAPHNLTARPLFRGAGGQQAVAPDPVPRWAPAHQTPLFTSVNHLTTLALW